MSALEQKMAARRQASVQSEANKIAIDVEAKQMAAPNLMGKIQAYIKEQVDAGMLRNETKIHSEIAALKALLLQELDSKIKHEVDVSTKSVFDTLDDHFTMVTEAGEEDFPLVPPQLRRSST